MTEKGALPITACVHADGKSNLQTLQPVVMDMGTNQQASGDELDKVLRQSVPTHCHLPHSILGWHFEHCLC